MIKKAGNGRERGQSLIVAALVMAVVMGFTAMAIDVGLMLEERRDNQNDADAAALAGVQYLPQQPATAMLVARDWALKNGVADDEIKAIEVRSTNVPNDTLYVEIETEFNWLFGRVLSLTTDNVGAKAKAVVGSLGGNNKMMPWGLLQGNSDCLDPNGNAIYGATCSVKVGAGSGITGWYGALDYDGNGGGSAEYEANIVDGTTETRYCIDGDPSPGCVSAVSVVDALNGNKVGGTDHGIDERLSETPCDKNGNGKDDFDDVFGPNPGPGATYTVLCDSPRLVIIPIVSYESEPVQKVTIRGWSLAYLDTYWCAANAYNPELQDLYVSADAWAATAQPCDKARQPVVAPVPAPPSAATVKVGDVTDLEGQFAFGPQAGPLPAPPRCHQGSPHGQQTCAPTPPPATPTPTATPMSTPAPTPAGGCSGNGHWEVQIKLVDAVYSQATGFISAYDGDAAITVRRLVE